jgi:hypothetical protein
MQVINYCKIHTRNIIENGLKSVRNEAIECIIECFLKLQAVSWAPQCPTLGLLKNIFKFCRKKC